MLLSLLLSVSQHAYAVPLQVTQQGRVLDGNGAGVSGLHNLTFRVYDSETLGTLLWEETLVVSMSNGYYATVLGTDETNNPLDSTILELYPIYLEFQLDSNSPVATRQAINSAPYAQIAGKAEVATSVNGGSVNATDVQISGNPVIDGTGSWVGQPITVDWNNIDPSTIPSYIADGDDNTQLSKTEVLNYVNGETLNLGASSQVDGSDIVTADSFSTYLPADADTLSSLNCATGEIASWDGNSSWVCTSDNTLEWADIELLLNNNPVDLNASTTIGGAEIITTVDDADTLASLSCSDGEIAKYDSGLGDWYCDVDIDTTLTSTEVTTIVEAGSVNLATGSTMAGKGILTQPTACTDGQILVYSLTSGTWACGTDTNTTLTASEVQAMVESVSGLALQAGATVDGSPIVTEASTLDHSNLSTTSATTGQVLTFDGSQATWSDASSGSECTESMVTHGDGSFYVPVDCGTYSYILKTGGATNFWSSTDTCTISYLEYDDNGVISNIDCGSSTHLVHKSHRSDIIVSSISTGDYHSCAIDSNGSIQCWGGDSFGEKSSKPTSGTWTSISSGDYHSCAIDSSGAIQCWGYDYFNQVSNTPSGTFSSLSSGGYHTCAIDSSGTIQCWGNDGNNQVSHAPTSGTWNYISSGQSHTCAIDSNGSVQCWGRDHNGTISDAPTTGTWTQISSENNYSCAIDSSGAIQCWGDDSYGRVNNAPTTGTWTYISSGEYHSCAIDSSGAIQCWGNNHNSLIDNTPTTGTWTSTSSGYQFNCATHSAGNVYCWGYDGQKHVTGVP